MWWGTAVTVLAALATLPDLGRPHVTGPGQPAVSRVAGNASETAHPEQLNLQRILGIRLAGDMYVSVPVISPLLVSPGDGSGSEPRPSFSHVYSIFEAGQKGTSPRQKGVWFRHGTVTMVLSYHYGCPVKLYRIHDGELTTELLGSPLENAEFRPTVVLWAGDLLTVESLCQDVFTFVSYVSVTAWNLAGKENWEAARVAAQFPQHAAEIQRLASPEFSADTTHLSPEVFTGHWQAEQ